MNGRGWIGWGLAGMLSLGLHGVVAAMTQNVAPKPVMDGGAVAGEIAIGTGFADLVQGRNTPVTPQSADPAPVPRAQAPVSPRMPTRASAEAPAEPVTVAPLVTTKPLPEMPHPAPSTVTPQKTVSPAKTVQGLEPVAPVQETAPPPKPKTLTARDEPRKQASPQPTVKGNARVQSKSGASDGSKNGKLAEKSSPDTKAKVRQAGEGALRSYQQTVLRQIARVPKRKAGARGKALVGMVIAPGGTIMSLRIIRSSGDDGVDRMALDTVRRAGPFGPTPDSRQMKLVVELKSKG